MSDPYTCKHWVIRPGQKNGVPIFFCSSCLEPVHDELRASRRWEYNDETGDWVATTRTDRHPLLGNYDSRQFKIYRTEHWAIFRFDGKFFEEGWDDDADIVFRQVTPEYVEVKLNDPGA